MLEGLFSRLKPSKKVELLDYAEARRLAADPDPMIRRRLAAQDNVQGEILYYLIDDQDPGVRAAVATNTSTPLQAYPRLVEDEDADVRHALLERLIKLLPDLSQDQQAQAYKATLQALETLAHDQVVLIRQALTNTLKDVGYAPPSVAKKLAQDFEQTVSEPILQLCVSLTDEDLLEIIAKQPGPWALAAIASRKILSQAISGAIVAIADTKVGSILLDNMGAVISEETWEHIVETAAENTEWQQALANRKDLPHTLALRMSEFVDKAVLTMLSKRNDFDKATAKEIAATTTRRLTFVEETRDDETPLDRAKRLLKTGTLTESHIIDAISWNDRDFVVAALSLLARVPAPIVEKILETRNGKVITALAWKAGVTMRTALQLQSRIASIPARDMLNARNGDRFPQTDSEMIWQLEFIGAIPPAAS